MKTFLLAIHSIFLLILNGCVYLHHIQIGDIDSRVVSKGQSFEVMVSETGVNLDEATAIASRLVRSARTAEQIERGSEILQYFQMGPKTGNIVFNERYAEQVLELILARCPGGRITGLSSIREMKKYPVISGEIVKITGWCQS